jgi:threonine synthase
MTYLIDLECPQRKQIFSAEREQTFCHECQMPILARYDLDAIRGRLDRDEFQHRPSGMWRWRELLPVGDPSFISSLGEGDTPILPISKLGKIMESPNFG